MPIVLRFILQMHGVLSSILFSSGRQSILRLFTNGVFGYSAQ